jgi:recombination protein RecA
MYGNPETTPGGRALKFYASVRIDVRKTDTLKQGGEMYGNRVKCKVVKNKVAPPFKVAEFDIIYGKGISKSGEIVDIGIDLGIVQKSGSWFSYNGERIGQGKENAKNYIESNEELLKEIEEKIKAQSDKIDLAAGDAYSLEDDEDEDGLSEGDFELGGDDDEGGEMDLRILDVSADD